jgi:hypothetical protein
MGLGSVGVPARVGEATRPARQAVTIAVRTEHIEKAIIVVGGGEV